MKSCKICGREPKGYLRKGRCDRCRQYLDRMGIERPTSLDNREARNGHGVAMRMYPAPLGPCENKCGREAMDRHHVDGNPNNNHRSNVRFLCRRCHMDDDGRLRMKHRPETIIQMRKNALIREAKKRQEK